MRSASSALGSKGMSCSQPSLVVKSGARKDNTACAGQAYGASWNVGLSRRAAALHNGAMQDSENSSTGWTESQVHDARARLRDQQQIAWDKLRNFGEQRREHLSASATYVLSDAVPWLAELPENCLHAVVTDPP